MSVMKGLMAMKEAMEKGVERIKFKDGESKVLRIVTPASEIVSVWEHEEQFNGRWKNVTCLGRNTCPLCLANRRASMKAYLWVIDRADGKVKLWKVSKTVGKQLIGLTEEYGDITARDFKVSRSGDKLETTYQFFPRDPKEEDFSDLELGSLEDMVEPMSVEAIKALMAGAMSGDAPKTQESETDYPF